MADSDSDSSEWDSDESGSSAGGSQHSHGSRRHRSGDACSATDRPNDDVDDDGSSSSSSHVRSGFRRRQQPAVAPFLRKRLSDSSLPGLAADPSPAAADAASIRPSASSDDERAKRRHHYWRRRCRLWLRRAVGPLPPCTGGGTGVRRAARHREDVLSACGTLILGTSCLVWVLLVLLPGEAVLYGSGPGRMATGTRGAGARHGRMRHHRQPPSRDRGQPPPPPQQGTVKRFVRGMAEHLVHRMERRARRQQADREGEALRSVEALRPGCVRPDWQLRPHPTPEPHEIDLPAILVGRHDVHVSETDGADRARYPPPGYLSNGLWRSVWVVYPRDAATPTVLKMMKPEHKVDKRNLERHARDAIVMDMLTSSPYVTDIYGFVGNSVLSEYIHESLDSLLYDTSSPGNTLYNETTHPTRRTPRGRLQLALDVARGIEALHTVTGGPIVHADLQAKQFLVTRGGTVKVNDFNRCRFMARRNDTDRPCDFRIPSAPGKARAPEEYAYSELNEQLDIYSMAHIIYGILSGSDPWYGWSSSEVKRMVQEGFKPLVPDKHRTAGTTDEALHNLTIRAYELDPAHRISATELVREIQRLLRVD